MLQKRGISKRLKPSDTKAKRCTPCSTPPAFSSNFLSFLAHTWSSSWKTQYLILPKVVAAASICMYYLIIIKHNNIPPQSKVCLVKRYLVEAPDIKVSVLGEFVSFAICASIL
ncbi:hypothetical protein ATANTOWER_011976 [Ataeniobius toweri]|uniref:Uncharacterized protein n=1 Tax=Ataeniobius toweri TaxID=208326 RepID=A0ABU7BK93_9TELE|nr:hypothetical protein [Ataeniobius toweri]